MSKVVNPISGRKITVGGILHKRLCKDIKIKIAGCNKEKTVKIKKIHPNNWNRFTKKTGLFEDKPKTIKVNIMKPKPKTIKVNIMKPKPKTIKVNIAKPKPKTIKVNIMKPKPKTIKIKILLSEKTKEKREYIMSRIKKFEDILPEVLTFLEIPDLVDIVKSYALSVNSSIINKINMYRPDDDEGDINISPEDVQSAEQREEERIDDIRLFQEHLVSGNLTRDDKMYIKDNFRRWSIDRILDWYEAEGDLYIER